MIDKFLSSQNVFLRLRLAVSVTLVYNRYFYTPFLSVVGLLTGNFPIGVHAVRLKF